MKKNLKNSWIKINLSQLNIWIIVLYGLSFWLSPKLNFNLPIYIIGSFYLLFLTPYNILALTNLPKKTNSIEKVILIPITIFFGLFTPFYFVSNYFFKIPFSFDLIFIFNLIISIILILKNKPSHHFSLQTNHITWMKTLKKYWPILLIFIIYLLLHAINYHFYIFMPEWDGYTKLIEIKNTIILNELETNYRGFFTVAIIIIQKFTYLPAYQVFTKLLILLQFIPILVVYLFLQSAKIKNRLYQFIVLLVTVSIPVLNMEIDYPRPQTVFIILFPIFIYFLYQALTTKKISYWLLAGTISIAGLNYHEFFLLPILIYANITIFLLYKKYYYDAEDTKDKQIFILIMTTLVLLGIILLGQIPFATYFLNVLKAIYHQIIQTEKWRWWFLNNYAGDGSGQQLGWPGITGAIKYYSYYTSPVIIFFLLIIPSLSNKKFLKKIIILLILPILLLILFYAEILPRLNYIWLPERMWLILDLSILLIIPTTSLFIKQNFSKKIFSTYLIFISILSLTGIVGSVYVAKNKKSLISRNEYFATQWIKENTPPNTLFITQDANGPMIKYFAERKFSSLPNDFFDNINVNLLKSTNAKEEMHASFTTLNNKIKTVTINDINDIKNLMNTVKKQKIKTEKLNTKIKKQAKLHKTLEPAGVYILYSKDKFKGLYAQREWWLKINFYNAPIDELTKKYPLVYNKNGIYIWKIK